MRHRPAAHCANIGPLNFGGGRLDGSSSACTHDGGELHDHFLGQSSFATHAISSELNVVKVDKDLQPELLGPLGCGIQTDAGAVLNAMKVHAGSSFAAFGTGAVGLAAIIMDGDLVRAVQAIAPGGGDDIVEVAFGENIRLNLQLLAVGGSIARNRCPHKLLGAVNPI